MNGYIVIPHMVWNRNPKEGNMNTYHVIDGGVLRRHKGKKSVEFHGTRAESVTEAYRLNLIENTADAWVLPTRENKVGVVGLWYIHENGRYTLWDGSVILGRFSTLKDCKAAAGNSELRMLTRSHRREWAEWATFKARPVKLSRKAKAKIVEAHNKAKERDRLFGLVGQAPIETIVDALIALNVKGCMNLS